LYCHQEEGFCKINQLQVTNFGLFRHLRISAEFYLRTCTTGYSQLAVSWFRCTRDNYVVRSTFFRCSLLNCGTRYKLSRDKPICSVLSTMQAFIRLYPGLTSEARSSSRTLVSTKLSDAGWNPGHSRLVRAF
jgi:hypothetical protein